MGTTVDAGHGFRSGINRGAMRIWLRLFLRISGAAVAIAVALGLVVVLAAAASQAQASPLPDDRLGRSSSATASSVGSAVAFAAAPAAAGFKAPSGLEPSSNAASLPAIAHVPAAPAITVAAVQLAVGNVLLALGFGCLLSRRGSRWLAGGAPAEAG